MFRSGKYRWALWFFTRPTLIFGVQVVVLAPLMLADDLGKAVGVYGFLFPLLVPVFGILNLPFLFAAFLAFRMDLRTRRNHALEHATIRYLERQTGRRFSGRAGRDGFRIAGPASVKEITAAFEQVRRVVESGEPLNYLSRRCGSTIVTSLGLGGGLLLLLAVGSVLLQPPQSVRAGALMAVVPLFAGLQHSLGIVIQRWRFMATDFDKVSLRRVRPVRRRFGRRPVHFLETVVVPRRL